LSLEKEGGSSACFLVIDFWRNLFCINGISDDSSLFFILSKKNA